LELVDASRDALLQWLHEGRILAGQLAATPPEHTAWVGIYPLSMERPDSRALLARHGIAILLGADVRAYRVRVFEIADRIRETFFGDQDIQTKQDVVVFGDDALFTCLEELGVPLEILDSARRVDYPL
jgi:hypothetical protein